MLLVTSDSVQEVIIDYTNCYKRTCLHIPCNCTIKFELEEDFTKDVFVYYSLSNYFQNHRRYVRSMESSQLQKGALMQPSDICEPFDYDEKGKPIAPCGIIANSLFNDSFQLMYLSSGHEVNVPMELKEIAWVTDKSAKYENPENVTYAFNEYYAKPPSWPAPADQLDPSDPENNGYLNERLMVWMRVAAFSSFRKLYSRVVHEQYGVFEKGLPKGQYAMVIEYSKYPSEPGRFGCNLIQMSS